MNKNSILFSISITFVALFLFILISFAVLYKGSKHREESFNEKRAFDIAHTLRKEFRHSSVISKELSEHLEFMEYKLIKEKKPLLEDNEKTVHWHKQRKGTSITYFKLSSQNYIHIKNRKVDILLLDNKNLDNFRTYIFFIFLSILVAFILLYITTINKLKPLSLLQAKVTTVGDENFDIECASDKKDEISQLANEFDKSVKKLKSLKESRNVFIRNIMHELKTPITKGQLLTQLPNTQENIESMQKVFYRLESLINEFATIEELISTKKSIIKKEYLLSDLVDNASDILMADEASVTQEFENIKVNVDFKLFSIAIKNLMDNAIKYSSDKKVTIKTEGLSIVFQNRGERLKHPLESYYEPFFKEGVIVSNQSFGLGLYIVKHILDANEVKLDYQYHDGVNSFSIHS